MPVTVVVGGQYGSEGKGKVAHWLAADTSAAAAIRVGGPNSGHTVVTPSSGTLVLRQLPTAAICPKTVCIIAPGSYVDPERILCEVRATRLPPDRLLIDPAAVVIDDSHPTDETVSGLRQAIGSTLSGTGAALIARLRRMGAFHFVSDVEALRPFVRRTVPVIRNLLDDGARVIVEGTQGYGLSVIHSSTYPYVTSRDTTAAAFVSEAGLSPLDVDDVVLVLRAFPIRVAGSSGPLAHEIDWSTVTADSGATHQIIEYTSVTHAVRRVGRFSPDVVREAIAVNNPTRIVLNHLDYIDHRVATGFHATDRVKDFVGSVSSSIGRAIDYFGFGPAVIVPSDIGGMRQTA